MEFETLAIHAGQKPDPVTGAIMPAIVPSTTFVQQAPGKHKGYDYSRAGNPTRDALEANLAALENAKFCVTFGSGCAAIATAMHLFKSGDHIVSSYDIYGGTYRLFTQVLQN